MELSHEINVTNLDTQHRRALEDVIGTQLHENQRLIISVTEVDVTPAAAAPRGKQSMSDWAAVYEGLNNAEVDAIDHEVNARANLTRDLP